MTVHRAWKVAVVGLVLGIALGAGGTLLITSSGGGGSSPAQVAACAQVTQLQKKVDQGPATTYNYASQGSTPYVSGQAQSLYNAAVSQLASQTALCNGH